MARRSLTITLDAPGIDEASEAVASFLQGVQPDRRSALSVRLSIESALMRLGERLGPQAKALVSTGMWLGRPRIIVTVRGERFDPRDEAVQSDWESMLLETSGLRPTYSYRGGSNVIVVTLPRQPLSGTVVSCLAIVLGVLLANAGMHLPAGVREELLTGVVTPLFDTFVGMLAGIAGPMVFLSVAWGICGIGDMATLGRSGKALIVRFLGSDLLATLFTLAVCLPIIPLTGNVQNAGGQGQIAGIVGLLLELLPTNIVAPFSEGNTLQIIVLALAVGIGTLALGNATEGLRHTLRELNALAQFLMEQLCRLLPAFIVIMMVYQTWSGTIGELISAWKPILIATSCMAAFVVVQVVIVSVRSGIAPARLVRTILPSLLLAFTTASSSAAFGSMLACCKDDLGADDDLSSFGIPLGMVLSKSMMAIQIVVLMLFAAQVQGVGADAAWYLRLGIICLLYTVAIPPVPGGSLACYGMMLAALGIPAQVLGVLTALDLLLDYPCTAGNVGSLILQVFSAADSLGLVDRDAQRSQGSNARGRASRFGRVARRGVPGKGP